MASPSALTLPAAAPARHFPISRRGRRAPRRQHPTGPLGGRDVRPCAGARSAARSGRASIVARDGPGLTISTVMDVFKRPVIGDTLDLEQATFKKCPRMPALGTFPKCRHIRNVPKCRLQRQALAKHGYGAHQDQHAGSVGQHRAQEFGILTAHVHGGKTNGEGLR